MSEPLELDAIETRANLATPGPWHYAMPSLKGYPQRVSNDAAVEVAETFDGPEFPPVNAEFIAHARRDVPALVAEVRSLRGQRARLDDLVAEYRKREETQDRLRELLTAERDKAREVAVHHRRRAEQAEAAVTRVRDLHKRDDPDSHYPRCTACPGIHWPCTTIDVLAGDDPQ